MDAGDFLNWEVEDILKQIDSLCDYPGGDGGGKKARQDYAEYTPEKLEKLGYADMQIEEIMLGISQGLPVEYYAKDCYNWRQMFELRSGLAGGLDIHLYENPLFSAEQMREIRKGLLDGLDVSSYAKLIYSTKDMSMARKNLLCEEYQSHPGGHAKTVVDEESGVTIRISDDCMEAFITLPTDREYTSAEVRKILKRNEVTFGISRELLGAAVKGEKDGKEKKVAVGKPASEGKDGHYAYFFNPLLPGEPKIGADGTADYTSVVVADKKSTRAILARYFPAEKGEDGQTVTGITIRGSYGVQLPALSGQGFTYDEETHTYRASTSGYVVLDEDAYVLNVWNVYIVDGDVNRYNGHISYNGAIYIKGSVEDLAEITASGNVVVDGFVGGAHIKAGENIVLRGGMNGSGRGFLEANGSVAGKFFEAATIYARGNVEGNYFMNCSITTDKSVIAKGTKSKIMGGSIKAGYSVESYSIMLVGRTATIIDVGDPAWFGGRVRQTQEKLSKVQDELRQLRAGKAKLSGVFGDGAAEQNVLFHKICVAIHMKEEEEEKLQMEKHYQEQVFRRAQQAYVQVNGKMEAGVTLSIVGKTRKTEKNVKGSVRIGREDL